MVCTKRIKAGCGRAVAVGLTITAISCVIYAISWEIIYYSFSPNLVDGESAYLVQKLQAAGASQAEMMEVQRRKRMHANPLRDGAIPLLEPQPIGLVVTLISALILRRMPDVASAESAASLSS